MRKRHVALVGLIALAMTAGLLLFVSQRPDGRALDDEAAAEYAANLANQKANELCGGRPFKSSSYVAVFKDGRWHWGHLEPGGFMAVVSFDRDGSNASVEVHHFAK